MLKKEIKFTNVLGEEETMTAYFNLNNVEYLRLSTKFGDAEGDLVKGLRSAVESNDGQRMIDTIEEFILSAYGTRPANDLSGFVKTPEARQLFASSEPYSELFMELLNNPESLNEFVNGLISGVKLNPKVPMQSLNGKVGQPLANNPRA